MELKAKAYIGAIISLGVLALGSGFYHWASQDVVRFLCYMVLAVGAACLKVSLPGVTGTMSVFFVFLLAGVVQLSLPETLLIGILCSVAQSFWQAKAKPQLVHVAFSIAIISIAVTATHYSYWAFPLLATPLRLSIAATVFFFFNTFPIAVVIALTEGKSLRSVWGTCYLWCFPYYLVGAAMVGALSFAERTIDWKAGLLVIPVVYVVYRSYQIYLRQLNTERERAAEEHRYAEEERKHSEEVAALQARTMAALESAMAANAKLDAVNRSSPLAVISLDCKGLVTGWNSRAEFLFGWSSEEVLGQPLPFANGRSEIAVNDLISRTLRGEAVSGAEMKEWRKDGTPFEASLWTALLRDGTSTIGILLTVADVSDRKRLEEQLRLSQKLEAVGRLAGGIAHDFNNLLTVINGYSSMLIDTVSGHAYASTQAQEILAAGNRAAELVSQLLTFSRRQVIKPRPLEVNQLVFGVERMLKRIIGEHIELRTDLHDGAGWIHADVNQMEGVLLNLATNARDAMPEGGILRIETRCVQVSEGAGCYPDIAPGTYARLVIQDTGLGMDAETQQRLFEPFFTTKAQGKGTGLGLSSVYGGIEQNNGRIFVSSELAVGSSFSIYMPQIPVPKSAENPVAVSSQGARGTERILLVEDEELVRGVLREALIRAGFRVWEASNGYDALEKWERSINSIDLVVTDIVMPMMNGLKLTQKLRAIRSDINVLCMSGHADDILSRQQELNPQPELLRKPFLPNALVQKAREVLDQDAVRKARLVGGVVQ